MLDKFFCELLEGILFFVRFFKCGMDFFIDVILCFIGRILMFVDGFGFFEVIDIVGF